MNKQDLERMEKALNMRMSGDVRGRKEIMNKIT